MFCLKCAWSVCVCVCVYLPITIYLYDLRPHSRCFLVFPLDVSSKGKLKLRQSDLTIFGGDVTTITIYIFFKLAMVENTLDYFSTHTKKMKHSSGRFLIKKC